MDPVTTGAVLSSLTVGFLMGVFLGYGALPDVVTAALDHLVQRQEVLLEQNRRAVADAVAMLDEAVEMHEGARVSHEAALQHHQEIQEISEQVTRSIEQYQELTNAQRE
jgi:hypothetical protein